MRRVFRNSHILQQLERVPAPQLYPMPFEDRLIARDTAATIDPSEAAGWVETLTLGWYICLAIATVLLYDASKQVFSNAIENCGQTQQSDGILTVLTLDKEV